VPCRAVELDAAAQARFEALRAPLLAARSRRERPMRDENVITSWNALMIQGLCAAWQATGTERHLQAARAAADFLLDQATMPDGGVYRAWRDGSARVGGFLDDYAMLAGALLDLYESCFEARYLARARELADRILQKFWDDGLYFTPADGEALVHRPRAPYDHAWPSGSSSAVFALLRLHELSGRAVYRERADQVMRQLQGAAARNPFGFSHLLAALDYARQGASTVILAGDRAAVQPLAQAVWRTYLPARELAMAQDVPAGSGRAQVDGRPAAYVCRNQTCRLPVTSAAALGEALAAAP
jgi:hypothetical protein